MGPLKGEVVLEDLCHRLLVRERHKLVVLCNILPIVDEHGLDVIRQGNIDHWFAVERVLLCMVSRMIAIVQCNVAELNQGTEAAGWAPLGPLRFGTDEAGWRHGDGENTPLDERAADSLCADDHGRWYSKTGLVKSGGPLGLFLGAAVRGFQDGRLGFRGGGGDTS
jgi:hypothetical protein